MLLAALAVLLLAPGLVLVRAPWPFVPLLSAAFWVALWAWTPWLSGSRRALVGVVVLCSLMLCVFRLLRFDGSRPRAAALSVAAAALLPLACLWPALPRVGNAPVPAGGSMPFQAVVAQLLVWRDGIPLTYEPLLSHPRFVGTSLGLPGLAADAALLLPVEPVAALAALSLAGEGLLILALYGGLVRRWPAWAAAVLALGVPAAMHLVGALPVAGTGPMALAAALLVGAGVLLAWASTNGSAVAAAVLAAAGFAAEPFLASVALPWLLAATWVRKGRAGGGVGERVDGGGKARVDGFGPGAAVFGLCVLPLAVAGDVPRFLVGPHTAGLWLSALAAAGPLGCILWAVHAASEIAPGGNGVPAGRATRSAACACAALLVLGAAARDRQALRDDTLTDADDRSALAALRARGTGRPPPCSARHGVQIWAPALAGLATGEPSLPAPVAVLAGAPRRNPCASIRPATPSAR